MAYDVLKAAIASVVKQNGNNEITGNLLQQALFSMINSLGANYQLAGIATPSTVPGTPDQNVFYLAVDPGTYPNFGGTVLNAGEIAVFTYNGSWAYDKHTFIEIVNTMYGGGVGKVLEAETAKDFYLGLIDAAKLNLFNKNTITQDAYIRSNDGSVATNQPGWWCSDFIPVGGSQNYSASQIRDFAFYDANKQYVSGSSQAHSNYTFTTPANAAYLRFSGYTDSDPATIMLNIGNAVLPYVDFGVLMLKDSVIPILSNSKLAAGIDGDKLLDKSIGISKLNEQILIRTNNLFNKYDVTNDAYIRSANGNVATNQPGWWCSGFIPVEPQTSYIATRMRDFAYYDENKQYISGSSAYLVNQPVTTPAGAKYLRFSWNLNVPTETPDRTMLNQGTTLLPLEQYVILNPDLLEGTGNIDGNSILDGSIPVQKLENSIIQRTANLFNKDTITLDAYINGSNGSVVKGSGAIGWWCSDFIPVEAGKQYNGSQFRDYAFYDESKQYVSGYGAGPTLPITAPAGAAYIRFSQYLVSADGFMFNEGATALPFVPYAQIVPSLIPANNESIDISLPQKIYAVVGDTLQLFFRGIIKAVNPYVYDICVTAGGGRMYPRYFEFTPQSTGTITFNLKVKRSDGTVVNIGTTTIDVKAAVKQPTSAKNVLFVGDSLTAAGVYTQEAYRRLTGSGGTPAGNGFGNIAFVGRRTYGAIHAEGNSGWSWADYVTKADRQYAECFTLTVNPVTVIPSVGAQYKDGDDRVFIMQWDYSNTKLKMSCALQSTIPASGILTKVSGTGDDTITYTAAVKSSINPFWNDDTDSLDFPAYVNKWCGGKIDIVYTLLTWNGQWANRSDFSSFINYAKTLYRHIHTNYPNVKIKMMGVQVPDTRQGMGSLGAPSENGYTDMYGLICTALNMNQAYEEMCNEAEFSPYVEFVHVSSQVDSEYNMPFTEKDVNTRNSNYKDFVGTNDVHPNTPGYLQIADVVYRNFIANFCQ